MISQFKWRFIAFTTMTFECFPYSTIFQVRKEWMNIIRQFVSYKNIQWMYANRTWRNDLLAILFMAIFWVIFDTIYILVTFFTSRNRTCKWFFIGTVWRWTSTTISHNKFRTEFLCRPWFIAIFWFRYHYLIFINFTAFKLSEKETEVQYI